MTTRRNILKTGAGLAAILASGKAPAALVKAMLAARQGIGGRAKLPFDSVVEYLRNTGLTQIIDTGVIPGEGLRVVCNIKPLELVRDKWAIGSITMNARMYVIYQYGSGNGKIGGGYGSYFAGTSSLTVDKEVEFDVEFTETQQIIKVDGEEKERFNKSSDFGTPAVSLVLFGNHSAKSFGSGFHCEIGATKIWMNDVLVRDLIPVRVGTTGYMYDRVSGKLFGNQGTGNFIVGPDVVEVEYLESTGTQYIDTLFKANTTTTKLQTSIVFNDTSTNQGVFGSRNLATGNSSSCNAFVISPTYFRPDWASGDGGANRNITISTGVAYDIEITRNSLTINGTTYTYSTGNSVDQTNNFLLFNFSNASDSPFSSGLKGRMMYAKLYSNNVLVRDFVPVRVGMEGAMMDRLTNKIYRNAGTGAFLRGSDAPRKMGGVNLICAKRSYRRSSWPSARCWREAA